ncbi:MAG: Rrf2 family transcriptional regulator [Candidatus Hinthialibacter antarcticus]|nr:Rrf2 family transcriptional regulator [Candidatus Hinthialibacter antarcticus]
MLDNVFDCGLNCNKSDNTYLYYMTMLNQTTEISIKTLIYLTLRTLDAPVSPKVLAEELNESPSYLAKITGLLVKAGILRAHRGVSGGVTLFRQPEDVTLLEIVEACQGKLLGDYCKETDQIEDTCGFHQAMYQVHKSTTEILNQWKLSDLARKPDAVEHSDCRMLGVCPKAAILKR